MAHGDLLAMAVLALLGFSQLASAHMEMMYPPPFNSRYNPFTKNIDFQMTDPLASTGANYPCKGYQSLLGTPEGASVATFAPGSKHNFTIAGSASHSGGSCQASLSYDHGKTFTVIQSIQGQCPIANGGTFDFTIPSDAPTGDALFAWSWFNEIGNREMYMNCASITIGGASSKREELVAIDKRASFSSRPAIFLANIGNGCKTKETVDLIFPNPGPDVINLGSKLEALSVADCPAAAAGGSGSGSGSGNGSGSSASSPEATPTATTPAGAASPTTTTAAPQVTATLGAGSGSGSSSSSSANLPGGVFITVGSSATAVPTTMATSTKTATSGSSGSSAGSSSGSGSATTSAAPASGTGTSSGGAGAGAGAGAAGTFAPGTACTNEGAWNCIGGTAFQRCASGAWSATISMAAGTSCKPGVSDTLVYGRRRIRSARRALSAWEQH